MLPFCFLSTAEVESASAKGSKGGSRSSTQSKQLPLNQRQRQIGQIPTLPLRLPKDLQQLLQSEGYQRYQLASQLVGARTSESRDRGPISFATNRKSSARGGGGGGLNTHQAETIHTTPMWTLTQRITHHSREYTSQDTKPQCGRYFRQSTTEISKSTNPRGRLCVGPF